jgi:hypothetical protein
MHLVRMFGGGCVLPGPIASRRWTCAVLAGLFASLLFGGIPVPALGHGGPVNTVKGHIQEDSVAHEPAAERRLERRTSAATATDAELAAAAVAGDPGQVGGWGPVVDWPVVGVHVALLENGKVLAYDSVGDNATETYPVHDHTRATVWDPATGTHTAVNVDTGYNLFCSGLAHLADGSLFLAGGNKDAQLHGIVQTHVFDSATNAWSLGQDMAFERWYPSVTPLHDGEMLITEGGPDVPEVRELDGGLRALNTASLNLPLYPWMDVAPDGGAFYSGPGPTMRSLDPAGGGSWSQSLGQRDNLNRDYGSHAMYDVGKILVTGGASSSSGARVIDINRATPRVSATAPMAFGRRQHNLTVLADGTVLATGGNSSGASRVDLNNGVYEAELWSPATGQWQTLAAMRETRQYHSTALLLPDGRVLSSGGGICATCDQVGYLAKNAEVFSPPYLFKNDGSGQLAQRPEITSAAAEIPYNVPFIISTPNAASIAKVALVRLGAVTHSVNMEQRYVPLSFTAGCGALRATAPANPNIAPPGVYMLFVIGADGVPSVARMVLIRASAPAPPAEPPPCSSDQPPTQPSTPQPSSGIAPRPAGPQPEGAGTSVDRKAPALDVRVDRRQRVLRARSVVAFARCDERCTVSARGGLRIGRRSYDLVRVSRTTRGDQRESLKVRLTRRATLALRRALTDGTPATVRIVLRGRDAAGNRSALVRATVRVMR